jgi:hypothetical protein
MVFSLCLALDGVGDQFWAHPPTRGMLRAAIGQLPTRGHQTRMLLGDHGLHCQLDRIAHNLEVATWNPAPQRAKPRGGLAVGARYKQRVTRRINHGRSTGVHRQLQVINDCAHPPTLSSVDKPEFIELPTIFVVLQPQSSSVITFSRSTCSAPKLA